MNYPLFAAITWFLYFFIKFSGLGNLIKETSKILAAIIAIILIICMPWSAIGLLIQILGK